MSEVKSAPRKSPKTAKPATSPAINGPQRRLHSGESIVPSATIASRALVFVIAIMTFLACLTLGGVSMINRSANDWKSDISREVTIQIKPSDDQGLDEAVRIASRIALTFDGVSKVTVLNDAATARLLEPWLGSGLLLDDLPIPKILTVSLESGAKPDFEAMRSQLAAEVSGVSLDDHRAWVDRLTSMAITMVLIGTFVFALMLAATVTTVIFATRGAMAGNRDVVEVLHFVGADGAFVSRQFQSHFLILGLKGACAGAVAAIFLFLSFGLWSTLNQATPEVDQMQALFGTFSPGWLGYLGMILVLFVVAALTALTSRWAVYQQIGILQDYKRAAGQ